MSETPRICRGIGNLKLRPTELAPGSTRDRQGPRGGPKGRELASVATVNQRLQGCCGSRRNRLPPPTLGVGSRQFLLLCTLGLCEVPLGPAAVRGFRLEVVVNRNHFTFRIDRWDHDGHTIMDHVAWSEDLLVAMAAYEAACRHWPGETVTLRQGTRVIEDSRKESLA